jgi:5-methylcytosine-specific restriction endonuclease McrA
MQRLNVRQSQIRECIEKSLFAIDQTPHFHKGEILLLQLVKAEAVQFGKLHARIEFALVYDHCEIDHTGDISRQHWPHAGKTWKYILVCSDTIPTIPFSLEGLLLSKDYAGQNNPLAVSKEDEAVISLYVWGSLNGYALRDTFGPGLVKEALDNYDVVTKPAQPRKVLIPEHEEFYHDPLLSESLKALYDHRCQVCGMNFKIKYEEPFSETHHIHSLSQGGFDISKNIIVICPNHHRIIHKTNAEFDGTKLLYRYSNGLEERLVLADHFEQKSFWT